jgi:hypothetical protein
MRIMQRGSSSLKPTVVLQHQPLFLLFPPPIVFLLVFSAFALTLSTVSLASPVVLMPK